MKASITTFTDAAWDQVVTALGVTPCELFNGNREAYDLALAIIHGTNVWDDLVDGDQPVDSGTINYAFVALTHDLQLNWFYQTHRQELLALWSSAILSWLASNRYELEGDDQGLHLAYVLRYAPAHLVTYAVYLAHGRRIDLANKYVPPLLRLLCDDDLATYKAEARGETHAV